MPPNAEQALPSDLTDDDVLRLLAQITRNTRDVTEAHQPAFYDKFKKYATDLNRISRHIDDDGLRKTYFHVAFLNSPLEEYLNYELQNRVLEYFEQDNLSSENSVAIEIVKDIATSLEVTIISDVDGRETIDIPELQKQLTVYFENGSISQNMSDSVLDPIISAIAFNYSDFVNVHSRELIEYYKEIEASCQKGIEREENKWYPVLETTSNQMVEMDREAISWKRVTGNGGWD